MSDVESILARRASGELSPEIALTELLLATGDVAATRAAAAAAPELLALLDRHAAGCARVVELARREATAGRDLEGVRRQFDELVELDEVASVALYSLGDPAILDRATGEIVAFLERRGLLAPHARVLDLGCGTGRLLAPLAARAASVVGLDVSPRMVEVAARRCASLPGVAVRLASGVDLAGVPEVDLVVAVDSFPYIVPLGAEVVARLFAELRRVVVPGGHVAIFNYSYDGDDEQLARHALASGLDVVIGGERPFALWDGRAFLLRRPLG